MTEEFKNL